MFLKILNHKNRYKSLKYQCYHIQTLKKSDLILIHIGKLCFINHFKHLINNFMTNKDYFI